MKARNFAAFRSFIGRVKQKITSQLIFICCCILCRVEQHGILFY